MRGRDDEIGTDLVRITIDRLRGRTFFDLGFKLHAGEIAYVHEIAHVRLGDFARPAHELAAEQFRNAHVIVQALRAGVDWARRREGF